MKKKKSNLGGYRPGAGRKVGSGKYGEPTRQMRIPESMVPFVAAFLRFKQEELVCC